jgi:hypothetical protein
LNDDEELEDVTALLEFPVGVEFSLELGDW